MLQQLLELLLAAAAVGKDLHLVQDALRHPGLDVPQVDSLLLQEEEEEERGGFIYGIRERVEMMPEHFCHLEESEGLDQAAHFVLQREDHHRGPGVLGPLAVRHLIDGTEGGTPRLEGGAAAFRQKASQSALQRKGLHQDETQRTRRLSEASKRSNDAKETQRKYTGEQLETERKRRGKQK